VLYAPTLKPGSGSKMSLTTGENAAAGALYDSLGGDLRDQGTDCELLVQAAVRMTATRRSGSIAVAGFPKLGSTFAASSLGLAEVGPVSFARIVERETSPPFAT
jgi:hypothetical protein